MIPLTWTQLETLTDFEVDRTNGPTNAQSRLRLFGKTESDVRVTLYRDNHAWCPYCQKIWLWLEEKQIPYRIDKVTMFCYGEKELWYKRKVPSGMLPAIELDGRIITESDDILIALEQVFGPLSLGMKNPQVLPLRRLERLLFRAWCSWLCYPASSAAVEQHNRKQFISVVAQVEAALASTPGPYFLAEFGTADVIFTPYVERMNASLYYYKGYSMREANPRFGDWFAGMESRSTYRGTQSDFHTHVHDLPPQMGGCYENGEPQMLLNKARVDNGPWAGLPDVMYPEPETSRKEALHRVIKHQRNIIKVNPADDNLFDEALRCALTLMMTGEVCKPPAGSDAALRYLRDRVNVPRDMSIYAAKRLREALEETAALVGDGQGTPILLKNRRDQDPANFV
ncbi:MAG: glutathione S-transferase family protein [Microcoleus sp. PH2017_10_PVI_O_A]|uniref:glutathione S-transferase family protein n=1 Tax=unclassified Microcoleus TaxID=2642155 RepID=UPI001DD93FB5|nr:MULTISPECIES: glutathione S-transferase [unclassified Microcoleus]TAE76531.1 MAG: glutathione S-transferase [Oscillatoriales cyanobacterium]MCC3409274.1 glutathione S-transferase family protein [Microcoleus sp. PH2017_10_PVI_O_A]MCC3463507.1 glutathione S-transferase family protein [Microcoleus sp. PH2017_11_PCY_U_A]MCC3481862.1 glutathione S-transferase family protein [Microcoleus sp. PH2017_12_PCY_D_A]MCC3531059.1 glutathione S-transferase family protein [Microcoleus sp. PH2017_21_RUC_O_A